MAAWRNGDYGRAADMFALTAKSTKSSSWLASGGAYWAARSSTRAGRADDAQVWYKRAAEFPRTFYGLVSLRTLGRSFDFNWDFPELTRANRKALESDLKVTAALRLSRDGELSAAITTLGSTKWMKSDVSRRSLLAYFQYKKDPAMTLYLARRTSDENGRFYDTALYPESPWEPKDGYEVDKAIIHALIRQESRFNPHAVSRTGALGLMQIMPSTAQYISTETTRTLSHPETNLDVGQKYVKYLLKDKTVNNDLFNMAVAYNAGPGNLSRWKTELKSMGDDPMLFIESIPSGETRAFVERVMVNYWIYRMRMGQGVPSLDAVAAIDSPSTIADSGKVISDEVAMAE
jgi:soluble lytic murein transglycosylase-like protein